MERLDALRELLTEVKAGKPTLREHWNVVFHKTATLDAAVGAYRLSLDAAKMLHEAVLPGWEWDCTGSHAEVFVPEGINIAAISFIGEAEDPARAWLIAILEALIALEEDKE